MSVINPYFYVISTGGIADSVSKWVFRHNLAPEQLKEVLQQPRDKEADGKLKDEAVEDGKEKDNADRRAGEEKEC